MWNGGLANEIAQAEIGDKLHWANGRAVLREAGSARAMRFAALRKWLGRLLITGGQRLLDPLSGQQTGLTSAG